MGSTGSRAPAKAGANARPAGGTFGAVLGRARATQTRQPVVSLTARRSGFALFSEHHADGERCVVPHVVLALNGAAAADLSGVAHADALHHRSGAQVAAHGARHDGTHPEHVERVSEARCADLRRVAL